MAGPLPAGTWSVILGLYEVPPSGVRWTVTVELEFAAEGAEPQPAEPLAPATQADARGSRRYRGDLHSHS